MEEVHQVEEGPVDVEEEELSVNMGMIYHVGGADVGMVASGNNLADGPIIL